MSNLDIFYKCQQNCQAGAVNRVFLGRFLLPAQKAELLQQWR